MTAVIGACPAFSYPHGSVPTFWQHAMTDDSTRRAPDAAASLDALCEAILERYHASAHGALPRIRGHLAALAEQEPACAPLHAAFGVLADHLASHLAKEEHILFPALVAMAEAERTGGGRPAMPFPTVLHPIRLMEAEHARLAADLDALVAAAGGFEPASGDSEGRRRALDELATFAADLHLHLRVENDVLFPRALDLDRRL
jgi:regulator of cell morphogenesis and NO signaling